MALARYRGRLRGRFASARLWGERHALARLGRRAAPRSRILCYHSVGTPEWGVNDVSPAQFRLHAETALRLGRRFVPADTIASGRAAAGDLALTFDDALASILQALPVLREYAIPFTVFVVTRWADRTGPGPPALSWGELEALARAGATIGSHSVTHPNFARISRAEAEDELGASRRAIADRLGVAPSAFAIPFGCSTDWPAGANALARAAGYTTIYAQSEDRRPPGTVGRTFITRCDTPRLFAAALDGRFDRWEEWT
jgi:peptidoglycan/xylan/chitin deacetylase (PgdA/CDA1 family)